MNLPLKLFYLLKELGPGPLLLLARYRLALAAGFYRTARQPPLRLAAGQVEELASRLQTLGLPAPPTPQIQEYLQAGAGDILSEAGAVLEGKFRLYGADFAPIELCPPASKHWSQTEIGGAAGVDIKDIWEPARFGWTYPLCRAYSLTGDEKYAEKYWQLTEEFMACNPVDQGPNWASAQEVAIRIINFLFAASAFRHSPSLTKNRLALLLDAVIEHAGRIPPTLLYARAQNNNHLLVEAAGLVSAGVLFKEFPAGQKWLELGWKWFHRALQKQIFEDGAYIQYSSNYHRLMLQTAVWVHQLTKSAGLDFPAASRRKLEQAVHWLSARVDPVSGRVPNLGHNDGAYLMPLGGDFSDYRPVLQAAGRLFCSRSLFPPGAWDEMSAWLDIPAADPSPCLPGPEAATPGAHKLGNAETWASIQVQRYRARPAHADQLHVDLWWKGFNLALDAGTYRYNAPPPFDNRLARTCVHNTIEIENQDQMLRGGRFLWLRRAHAHLLPGPENQSPYCISARHDGYRALGFSHTRRLDWDGGTVWKILDEVTPLNPAGRDCHFTLSWLLPDYPWEMDGQRLTLHPPCGAVTVEIAEVEGEFTKKQPQLARAGKLIAGAGDVEPYQGWYSPTYGKIVPALAFRIAYTARPPVKIRTTWSLGGELSS